MYSKRFIIYLGTVLAFTAGAINAGGFLAVGHYTSHMTGIASSIADYVVLHNVKAAVLALGFIFSFIFGAATTSVIANYVRAKYSYSEYTPVLMFEALLLLAFSVMEYKETPLAIMLLCFVMGLQNAAITKISQSRIRTTHITGLSTDIGIGIGRCLYKKFLGKVSATDNDYDISLYSCLVGAFIAGGLVGVFLYQAMGWVFTVPLTAILLLSAVATTYYKLR